MGNSAVDSTDASGKTIFKVVFAQGFAEEGGQAENYRTFYMDLPTRTSPINAPAEVAGWRVASVSSLTTDQARLVSNYYAAGGSKPQELIDIFNAIHQNGEYLFGMETCNRYIRDLSNRLTTSMANIEIWDYHGNFPGWNHHAVIRFQKNGITIGYVDDGFRGRYFSDHIFFQDAIPNTFDADLQNRRFPE